MRHAICILLAGASVGCSDGYSTLSSDDASNTASDHSDSIDAITGVTLDGSCGTANGVAIAQFPTVGLCSTGVSSEVLATGDIVAAGAVMGTGGTFNWNCLGSDGGTNASCSAPLLMSPPPTAYDPCTSTMPISLHTGVFDYSISQLQGTRFLYCGLNNLNIRGIYRIDFLNDANIYTLTAAPIGYNPPGPFCGANPTRTTHFGLSVVCTPGADGPAGWNVNIKFKDGSSVQIKLEYNFFN